MAQNSQFTQVLVEVEPYKEASIWSALFMIISCGVGLFLGISTPKLVDIFFKFFHFGTIQVAFLILISVIVWGLYIFLFRRVQKWYEYDHEPLPKTISDKVFVWRWFRNPTPPASTAGTTASTTAATDVAHRIICMEDPNVPGRVLYMRKRLGLESFAVTERLFFDNRIGPVMAPPANPLPGELREIVVTVQSVKIHLLRIANRAIFDTMFRRDGSLYVPELSFVRGDNGPIEVIFDDWALATGIEKEGYDAFSALAATGFTIP